MKKVDDEPTFKQMAFSSEKEMAQKTATIEEQREELAGMKRPSVNFDRPLRFRNLKSDKNKL